MISDSETVREALEWVTSARFEIAEPLPHRLRLREQARWFVRCHDIAQLPSTGHLRAAWRDKKGTIWFESTKIADMVRLVENLYGEEGAAKMPDPPVGVTPGDGIPPEVAGYPRVVSLLESYQQILAKIAERTGTPLKLQYDGGAGLTSVRLCIPTTNFNELDVNETKRVVESVSKVLREAYDEVLSVRG